MNNRDSHTVTPGAAQPTGSEQSVHAIARAIRLLDAFQISDAFVTLTELSRRAGIHKTTTLRIARTLAESHYLVQRPEDGAWRLGPAAGWLGARYQASYDVNNAIEPVLLELSQATHESASFFVREGKIRTCLVRAEGPQAIRHHIRVGEVLPLEKDLPDAYYSHFPVRRVNPMKAYGAMAITYRSVNATQRLQVSQHLFLATTGNC